ncbi:CLUMA_CG014777, isoform A [Clunio marinus]|uniref:CLUMA_CG014777, isoform A n=1 Tax=Clunio marinus TaxID=568069 RepID=A0A1J1ILB9_9DIPT|nr:CLUMA_CG014777, isoform A [Clunio marinus]
MKKKGSCSFSFSIILNKLNIVVHKQASTSNLDSAHFSLYYNVISGDVNHLVLCNPQNMNVWSCTNVLNSNCEQDTRLMK